MIRPIVQLGDAVLKTKTTPLAPGQIASPEILRLVEDMKETLEASGGVGLAAPQVGESVSIILAGSFPTEHSPERPEVAVSVLVNPVIVDSSSELDVAWEGCLSFMQYRVRVERPRSIAVEYLTLGGRPARLDASGFFARVLQHEIDHLNGILTLDRAVGPEDVARVDEETTPATDESKGRAEHS